MAEINNALTTDTTPAKKDFLENFKILANGLFDNITEEITSDNIDKTVNEYLEGYEPSKITATLEQKYIIPKDTFKTTYSGLLKVLLNSYYMANSTISQNSMNIETIVPNGLENATDSLSDEARNISV